MKEKINNVTVECIQGDITSQPDMDAIVNAANAQLTMGGGVAGAIHRAAGPELAKECRPKAPIEPGEAVISDGYNLPNGNVIHCLGPVYGRDKPEDKLLADCYKNALDLAEDNNIESIAFPAISTGAFGYPTEDAAKVALKTVLEKTKDLETVKHVRFVLYDDKTKEIQDDILSKNIE